MGLAGASHAAQHVSISRAALIDPHIIAKSMWDFWHVCSATGDATRTGIPNSPTVLRYRQTDEWSLWRSSERITISTSVSHFDNRSYRKAQRTRVQVTLMYSTVPSFRIQYIEKQLRVTGKKREWGSDYVIIFKTIFCCKSWQSILDFKLLPCFESCMYSFGYFPGVRLWFADVSEPSISSIFKGWRWNWYSVPKRRQTTIGRRGNTQKNTYLIEYFENWKHKC